MVPVDGWVDDKEREDGSAYLELGERGGIAGERTAKEGVGEGPEGLVEEFLLEGLGGGGHEGEEGLLEAEEGGE